MKKRTETKTKVDENGRVCTGCLGYKEWKFFPVSNQTKTGHGTKCNECLCKIRNKKYKQKERGNYNTEGYFSDKYSISAPRYSY